MAVHTQVVRTTVEPLNGRHPGVHYDAYEYLANHHSYKRDEHPTVKFTYNLSPLQVRVAAGSGSGGGSGSGNSRGSSWPHSRLCPETCACMAITWHVGLHLT